MKRFCHDPPECDPSTRGAVERRPDRRSGNGRRSGVATSRSVSAARRLESGDDSASPAGGGGASVPELGGCAVVAAVRSSDQSCRISAGDGHLRSHRPDRSSSLAPSNRRRPCSYRTSRSQMRDADADDVMTPGAARLPAGRRRGHDRGGQHRCCCEPACVTMRSARSPAWTAEDSSLRSRQSAPA